MRHRGLIGITVLLAATGSPVSATVLSFQEAISAPGLGNVGSVVVSPDGRHVYATSGRDATPGIDGPTVVVLARDGTGRLSFVQLYFEGPAPGPFCGAGALAVTSDGRHVYVAATCAQRVRVFARDPVTGVLSPVGHLDHEAGRQDGPGDLFMLATSPDGASLYTLDSQVTTLGVFRRDPGVNSHCQCATDSRAFSLKMRHQLPEDPSRFSATGSGAGGGSGDSVRGLPRIR